MKKKYSCCLFVGLTLPVSFSHSALKGPDFNNDGFADAAFGMPHVDRNDFIDVGQVMITYGSNEGLQSVKGKRLLHRNIEDVQGVFSDKANFGAALAWGDFNQDGYSDLVVGVPGDEVNGSVNAGSVQVFYGSKACEGLCQDWNKIIHRDLNGMADDAESGDNFGAAVIAGDFNGDGFDDLAIGVPNDSIIHMDGEVGVEKAGTVHIIYGAETGLIVEGNQIFHLDTATAWGDHEYKQAQPGAYYGGVLTAGDYNCDGVDDLAISAQYYDWDMVEDAGIVHVIYGAKNGLNYIQKQPKILSQNSELNEEKSTGDLFGFSLASGNFNADSFNKIGSSDPTIYECQDLVIGVPFEDKSYGSVLDQNYEISVDQGIVHVIYGSSSGLGGFTQIIDRAQTKSAGSSNDIFGFSLAAANFNADFIDDLIVGVVGDQTAALFGGSVDFFGGTFQGLDPMIYGKYNQDTNYVLPGNTDEYDQFGFSVGSGNFNGKGYSELIVGAPFSSFGKVEQRGMIFELHTDTSYMPPELTYASRIWIHGGECKVVPPYQCSDFEKKPNDPSAKTADHLGQTLTSMRPIIGK